jgi:hypothetical protein
MGELMRRDGIGVSRATGRELRRIREQEAIKRAELEAEEHRQALKVDLRVTNGCVLATRAVQQIAMVDRHVSEVSRDNPGRELMLRPIAETVSVATQSLIYHYMTRP